MLILTRKEGESLHLSLHPDTPRDMTVHELFSSGPIIIAYKERLDSGAVRVGIQAPAEIFVLREELLRFTQENVGS